MDPNHHLHKPVMIGEIKGDGQFSVVWKTKGTVRAQPWSPFIPGNENKPDRVSSVWPLDFGTETATANSLNAINR
jgi:urea transport system substrate-binding protein